MKKVLKWLATALYGLVMIEVVVMISPFAFYWYSLYAPTLQGLHRSSATAWTEAFFLPHSVITTSLFLEFMRWQIGAYAFGLGLLAALVCGVQVYATRLLLRKAAVSWMYSYVRHPFYLSLAVAGFGLLTIWPRIIILILYLGMLFLYFFLARFEEKQVEAAHPAYATYRQHTGMFLPGNPGGKLYEEFFGWIPNQRLALAASSALIVVLVLGGAVALRRYTIGHAATMLLPADRTMAIAIWPTPPAKIQQVVSAALQDPKVRAALDNEPGAAFTAHMLPQDYGMVNMFADVGTDHRMFSKVSVRRLTSVVGFAFPFFAHHQRNRIMGSPQEVDYKIIFSRVDEPGNSQLPVSQVTDLSAKMTPIVIANVSGESPVVESVMIPPRRSFWGDITMPMF
jgi:protein-S-isoprenylcysteine O-methyltransferase Ste14